LRDEPRRRVAEMPERGSPTRSRLDWRTGLRHFTSLPAVASAATLESRAPAALKTSPACKSQSLVTSLRPASAFTRFRRDRSARQASAPTIPGPLWLGQACHEFALIRATCRAKARRRRIRVTLPPPSSIIYFHFHASIVSCRPPEFLTNGLVDKLFEKSLFLKKTSFHPMFTGLP
jgi:hypothetical protein